MYVYRDNLDYIEFVIYFRCLEIYFLQGEGEGVFNCYIFDILIYDIQGDNMWLEFYLFYILYIKYFKGILLFYENLFG